MKFLFLDVYNNKLKTVEANGLEDYYRLIGCRTIDIISRKIGDIDVEIVIDDDEGILDCLRHGIDTINVCLNGEYRIKKEEL